MAKFLPRISEKKPTNYDYYQRKIQNGNGKRNKKTIHLHSRQPENRSSYRRNKVSEETIKRAELDFMLPLQIEVAKPATDAELDRVKLAMSREDKKTVVWPRNIIDSISKIFL